MLISTLFISLLSLVVCLCAASPQPLLVRLPPVSTASLTRRQVTIGSPSPLPSQCSTTCSTINNEISLGCPFTACCTTTFETQYYNCLECIGQALNAANYSTAQNSLNLLYTTCVDAGFVLPRMELPGQTANSSSSTPSTGAATGSAVGSSWRDVRVEALLGAAVLLGVAGLW